MHHYSPASELVAERWGWNRCVSGRGMGWRRLEQRWGTQLWVKEGSSGAERQSMHLNDPISILWVWGRGEPRSRL